MKRLLPINRLYFNQLFDIHGSSTYTYLLACPKTFEAILIDPVLENVSRDANIVKNLQLKLKYVMNTHIHADHITGTGKLKTEFPDAKSIISTSASAKADIFVQESSKIEFGDFTLNVKETPGHTNGCISYFMSKSDDNCNMVFTGDALMIRGCGRTDFQEGSSEVLYNSVHKQLFTLPDDTIVYPAHNYNGVANSTILEEKLLNPRLTKNLDEFIKIMDNLSKT